MPAPEQTKSETERTFVPLPTLAYRLGLSGSWLKAEAEAGRLPCLRVGRKLMFNIEAIEATLVERARSDSELIDASGQRTSAAARSPRSAHQPRATGRAPSLPKRAEASGTVAGPSPPSPDEPTLAALQQPKVPEVAPQRPPEKRAGRRNMG